MAKHLKLTIKNEQIAQALNLGKMKNKLSKKEESDTSKEQQEVPPLLKKTLKIESAEPTPKEEKEEAPRIRARSRSAFAEPALTQKENLSQQQDVSSSPTIEENEQNFTFSENVSQKTSEELRKEIFGDAESQKEVIPPPPMPEPVTIPQVRQESVKLREESSIPPIENPPASAPVTTTNILPSKSQPPTSQVAQHVKLGPTGKHISDLLPGRYPKKPIPSRESQPAVSPSPAAAPSSSQDKGIEKSKGKIKGKIREPEAIALSAVEDADKKGAKSKFKEFRDIKPVKRTDQAKSFDARDRHGLRDADEDQHWRRRKAKQQRIQQEDITIRPTSLKIRIPISIKDLAAEMKLKASQLIAKLFLQGLTVTLNDILEDETTIQLLGHEFGCEISIDTKEEERIRITGQSIREEVKAADPTKLTLRPPIVAFMGHVDHGKTSLIDAIRKSNRVAGEAGAITQHIGAFKCSTSVGDIAILDTPGHEAFSAMRARGAEVTDIVVLVIAGDEGMRQQTIEALQHAQAAKVSIVVAINKCDKPNFNPENVYRQLAENGLLPEAWGGQTITVNCSAVTGEGISHLLEMLALQAEVLELKADPTCRARGTVLESEMHKGMGAVTTVLVQNGTLRKGDAIVFAHYWGKVKTMHDEHKRDLLEAGPSSPVEITGLSGLPEAGQEFIVVKNEKEAREISEARALGIRQVNFLQAKKLSMENLFQQAADVSKKILNIVLRADVQGSLEAIKAALLKIHSDKIELNVIFAGVGEISESDVQLAAASKAVIIGFHTQIESHAEALVKQLGVQIKLHDIIYHAIDDVRILMGDLLDKIVQETDKGKALVKAIFKSSQYGNIAGCIVSEGTIHRSHNIRVRRNDTVIWTGTLSSLKRVKEDVREVAKGLECGIVLNGFSQVLEGDVLESYEVTYISQDL